MGIRSPAGRKALRRDLGRRGRGARSPAASPDKSRRRKRAGESDSESTGAHRRHVIEGIGATSRPSNAANGRHIGCARPQASEGEEDGGRAALITGASSGIGLAIARALGEDGYALTVSARRPEKLETAAEGLRANGIEVQSVAANMTDEEDVVGVFARHRDVYGRLDVLVNNAGVGIGAPMEQIQTKHLDMQLAVNLRALILGTREGLPMLREAGVEHGKALIVNTASIAGKGGQAWLSIYAATKAAVINFTQSTTVRRGAPGSSARRWRRASSTRR